MTKRLRREVCFLSEALQKLLHKYIILILPRRWLSTVIEALLVQYLIRSHHCTYCMLGTPYVLTTTLYVRPITSPAVRTRKPWFREVSNLLRIIQLVSKAFCFV